MGETYQRTITAAPGEVVGPTNRDERRHVGEGNGDPLCPGDGQEGSADHECIQLPHRFVRGVAELLASEISASQEENSRAREATLKDGGGATKLQASGTAGEGCRGSFES